MKVKVLRRESGGMSDHHLVEGQMTVGMRWMRVKQFRCVRKALKMSELNKRK